MNNFWTTLNSPFFALAPMEDVTDVAFREMFARHSHSNPVFFTEFVSVDGIVYSKSNDREKLFSKLLFTKKQRPIVAQVFGAKPNNFIKALNEIKSFGFDGVDINMGCPDRSVERQGAGAALIKTPDIAKEIITNSRSFLGEDMPLSVKTRIGYNAPQIEEWIGLLLSLNLDALTIHLRTRKEMSLVPAHWEFGQEILKMRNKISPKTKIILNGDIISLKDGENKCLNTGADGVMTGRGVFGNPSFFAQYEEDNRSVEEKINQLIEHIKLFDKFLFSKGYKGFYVMKKHFKAYINGWNGAKELRIALMETTSPESAIKILKEVLKEK